VDTGPARRARHTIERDGTPGIPIRAATAFGRSWELRALGHSTFCDTWQASQGRLKLFVKSTDRAGAGMLRAEADGLRALAATGTIRVPAVHALEDLPGGGASLALEWLDFACPDAKFGARFGRALARLHMQRCPMEPESFGWRSDNFIGATPQRNTPLQPACQMGWLTVLRAGAPVRDARAAAGGGHGIARGRRRRGRGAARRVRRRLRAAAGADPRRPVAGQLGHAGGRHAR
jgi:hypothetical protein